MGFEEGRKLPNPTCPLCKGEGSISQSGYDDSDLHVHFGSVDCDCTKKDMSDDILMQRINRIEEYPESTVPWKYIRRSK